MVGAMSPDKSGMEVDAFIGVLRGGEASVAAMRMLCLVGGIPAGEVEWAGAFFEIDGAGAYAEAMLLARILAMRPAGASLRIWTEDDRLLPVLSEKTVGDLGLPSVLTGFLKSEMRKSAFEIEPIGRVHSPSLDGVFQKAARVPASRARDFRSAMSEIEKLMQSPLRSAWTQARTAPWVRPSSP